MINFNVTIGLTRNPKHVNRPPSAAPLALANSAAAAGLCAARSAPHARTQHPMFTHALLAACCLLVGSAFPAWLPVAIHRTTVH